MDLVSSPIRPTHLFVPQLCHILLATRGGFRRFQATVWGFFRFGIDEASSSPLLLVSFPPGAKCL